MCRNIKTLFNFEPPVTDDEVRAASLQFVRKLQRLQQAVEGERGGVRARGRAHRRGRARAAALARHRSAAARSRRRGRTRPARGPRRDSELLSSRDTEGRDELLRRSVGGDPGRVERIRPRHGEAARRARHERVRRAPRPARDAREDRARVREDPRGRHAPAHDEHRRARRREAPRGGRRARGRRWAAGACACCCTRWRSGT